MPNMNKVVRTHREKCDVCGKLVKLYRGPSFQLAVTRTAGPAPTVTLFRYARHNTRLYGGRCIGGGSPSKFQYAAEPKPETQS